MIDGQERVLEFVSLSLSKAKHNYSVTERECLTVIWAIEKFRAYVEGYNFLVVTDHSSLRWIRCLRSPTGRLARWSLRLQMHNFEIEHRKGSLNCVPDALSRMYDEDGDEEQPVVGAVSWAGTTNDVPRLAEKGIGRT